MPNYAYGTLSTLFNERDKPEARTSGISYSFLFDGNTIGKPVNELTAMKMTAMYSW